MIVQILKNLLFQIFGHTLVIDSNSEPRAKPETDIRNMLLFSLFPQQRSLFQRGDIYGSGT